MKALLILLLPTFAFASLPYAEVLNRVQVDLRLNEGHERLVGKDCSVPILNERDQLDITVAQGFGNRFASFSLPASGMTRAFGDKITDVVYKNTEAEKSLSYRQTRNSAGKEVTDVLLKVTTGKSTLYTITINDRMVYCEIKN